MLCNDTHLLFLFHNLHILWAIKAINKDMTIVTSFWKSKLCCIIRIVCVKKVLQKSYSLLPFSVFSSLVRRYLFPPDVSVVVWSEGSAAGSFECRCLSGICRATRHTHTHSCLCCGHHLVSVLVYIPSLLFIIHSFIHSVGQSVSQSFNPSLFFNFCFWPRKCGCVVSVSTGHCLFATSQNSI